MNCTANNGVPRTQSKSIRSLQVIRAIAFCGIFVYHAIRTFPGSGRISYVLSLGLGPWGVSVFFVLSGFLMTYSYWDKEPKRTLLGCICFALNKIKKLYPLHLIMLLAGSVFLMMQNMRASEIGKQLLITIPLLQTWFPTRYMAINVVAWYLSVTLFLYFSFPIVISHVKGKNTITEITGIITVFALQLLVGFLFYRFSEVDMRWITYCHPLYRLGDFVTGCHLAAIYQNTSRISSKSSVGACTLYELIAITSNVFVCVCFAYAPNSMEWYKNTCLFIPTSVLLVFVFSIDGGVITSILQNRFVFWIAYISPYAFLIHRLAINYLSYYMNTTFRLKQFHFVWGIVGSFVLTVVLVYVYMGGIEVAKKVIKAYMRWQISFRKRMTEFNRINDL